MRSASQATRRIQSDWISSISAVPDGQSTARRAQGVTATGGLVTTVIQSAVGAAERLVMPIMPATEIQLQNEVIAGARGLFPRRVAPAFADSEVEAEGKGILLGSAVVAGEMAFIEDVAADLGQHMLMRGFCNSGA